MNSYLADQNINSVIIPSSLIKVGATYHFKSSYQSVLGETVTGVLELTPVPELPVIEFSGGSV